MAQFSPSLFTYPVFFLQIAEKDSKIRETLEEIQKQMEAYQNLMQIKTALDMEIAVYKKLLESEEDRLGIVTGHGKYSINPSLHNHILFFR